MHCIRTIETSSETLTIWVDRNNWACLYRGAQPLGYEENLIVRTMVDNMVLIEDVINERILGGN